jgi:hypothetical protein
MRLSIDKRDTAYRTPHHCSKFRIFLDGKELFDCITADSDKGIVIRQWTTRHPVTRELVTQKSGIICGKVEIVRKEQKQTIVFDELTGLNPLPESKFTVDPR